MATNTEVQTRAYHTINPAVHLVGDTYLVPDTLLDTVLACGFAWPTKYTALAPLATGATAGAPATWTPAGARARYNLADLAGIVATPGTAWTTGQYALLQDATHAYWNGSAWVAGNAP